ncbi:MAG: aspartate/glutamate racemase family protein [Ignavibacteriaceae bacterium]|nr:aspartate/glutamate racemase family protein [Ignavibacteriaceae bacterium]
MINLKDVLSKEKISIVITDSGLGGISVCAGIEEKLRENNHFKEVNLIFFNALPQKGAGYNSMPNLETKAEVFNKALFSMVENYSPDLILIACNTLSVVFPFTEFSKISKTPVLGIVDFGVQMILEELKKNQNQTVMILGTQTTISSQVHKNMLKNNFVKEDQIVTQAIPNLESEIQKSSDSIEVKRLIEANLIDAINKSHNTNEPITAALCCTHYGFCKNTFQSAFEKLTNREVTILNPNELMINSITGEYNRNRFASAIIQIKVVSRAVIEDDEKNCVAKLVSEYAPQTAFALLNYKLNPNLFDFHAARGFS